MKKSILLALLALALPASAGTIDWKLNTLSDNNYMVGSDGNKLSGFAYLVLTTAYEEATITKLDDITALALGGDSLEITDGVNKNLVTTTDSRITPVDGVTSLSFTVLVYDKVNKSFFASAEKTEKAYQTSGDEFTDPKQISFTAANLYATAAKRGTQEYHPIVPEPSVALMGLLGLGMLLKRRRA